MTKTYCCIDTETYGLEEAEHRLISVGLVFGSLDMETETDSIWGGQQFFIADDPGELDQRAQNINGIDPAWLEVHGEPKADVAVKLDEILYREFIKAGSIRLIPLGQNWPFDRSFLRTRMPSFRETMRKYLNYHYADSAVLAEELKDAGIMDLASCSLQSLATYFGIEYEAHDALADAETTLAVYFRMKRLLHNLMVAKHVYAEA